MAKLKCVRHNLRVQVIDIGTADNSIPLTVHRNSGKRNDVCDSNTVGIDGEYFTPSQVLVDDWSDSCNWDSDDNLESELGFVRGVDIRTNL